MECLGRYTFLVMTSVILSGGVKMKDVIKPRVFVDLFLGAEGVA